MEAILIMVTCPTSASQKAKLLYICLHSTSVTNSGNQHKFIADRWRKDGQAQNIITFSGAYPTAKFGDGAYYFDGTGDK